VKNVLEYCDRFYANKYVNKRGLLVEIPHYSTDWSQGMPIIEREIRKGMNLYSDGSMFGALYYDIDAEDTKLSHFGPDPLIAAMRCRVASKLGDEVEIPEELLR
jgi:hypothetical protein